MSITKLGRHLSTIPFSAWWIADKLDAYQKKTRSKRDADAIDNLERLYRLKEHGVITGNEYDELKQKLKEQI